MDIMIMIMRAATRERGKVERRQAGGQEIGRMGEVGEGGPPPPMPPSKAEILVYCFIHDSSNIGVEGIGQALVIH